MPKRSYAPVCTIPVISKSSSDILWLLENGLPIWDQIFTSYEETYWLSDDTVVDLTMNCISKLLHNFERRLIFRGYESEREFFSCGLNYALYHPKTFHGKIFQKSHFTFAQYQNIKILRFREFDISDKISVFQGTIPWLHHDWCKISSFR